MAASRHRPDRDGGRPDPGGWGRSRGRRSRPSEAVLVADGAAPAGRAALATLLRPGRGELPAAGGAAGDPDAAQQVQGRLRVAVRRVGWAVHPRRSVYIACKGSLARIDPAVPGWPIRRPTTYAYRLRSPTWL